MFEIINDPTRVTQTTKSLIDHCITNSQEKNNPLGGLSFVIK